MVKKTEHSTITSATAPKSMPRTEILYGVNNAVGMGIEFMQNAKEKINLCCDKNGPSIIIEHEAYKNNYIEAKKRGTKIRLITDITRENLHYSKELAKIVNELRHLDGMKGGIAVSESEFMGATTLKEKELLAQVTYSNARELVEQSQYIFDTLWNKAISGEERIKEIEQGIKPSIIETIRNPAEVQRVTFDLLKAAREEVLVIFSSANALARQKRLGGLELLKAAIDRGVRIRILTPFIDNYNLLLKELQQQGKESKIKNKRGKYKHNQNNDNKVYPKYKKNEQGRQIDIRFIESNLQTKVSILIVDRKYCLTAELIDDTKKNSSEAMGLATYSNSKSTVLSYATIFEALWRQVDLYREVAESKIKLESANKQLKLRDKTMEEFVNIAAHELRTPLQPIISYNALARKERIDKDEALSVIDKYAKKLQNLASDLLAVSRIEGGRIPYRFEKVKINELISDVVDNMIRKNPDLNGKHRISVNTNLANDLDEFLIDIDKERMTEVLDNILGNAIKFTKKGNITIESYLLAESTNNIKGNNATTTTTTNNSNVQIKISDTGPGIPNDIMPKLFKKFVTKSMKVGKEFSQGTGLGLFISKSIIEAHNGNIYAYNNDKGGATFVIELPT